MVVLLKRILRILLYHENRNKAKMKQLIWWQPPWVHELILKLTGYRLVLIREDIPELAHLRPRSFLYQRMHLEWTKKYPL